MSATKTAPGEGCCAFRPDIEGLRAIAILAVVIYHAGIPGFAGGFVGVDVFFVLSGFLITGILVRELTQTGTVHLGRFWARRMRRLLPAAFLVLAATGLASAIWLPPAERGAAAQGIAASTLYGANWVFATQALDYLAADHALSPTLHFWSLAVEEQFYMVWPLLLLAVTWRARQDPARMVRRLLVAMVAICLISFAFSVLLTRAAQPMAFFASPPRFWQLGVGALLAIGWAGVARLPAMAREVGAGAGLVLVAASISLMPLLLAAGHTWPGALALGPTLGTALLVAAGSETRVGRRSNPWPSLGSSPTGGTCGTGASWCSGITRWGRPPCRRKACCCWGRWGSRGSACGSWRTRCAFTPGWHPRGPRCCWGVG